MSLSGVSNNLINKMPDLVPDLDGIAGFLDTDLKTIRKEGIPAKIRLFAANILNLYAQINPYLKHDPEFHTLLKFLHQEKIGNKIDASLATFCTSIISRGFLKKESCDYIVSQAIISKVSTLFAQELAKQIGMFSPGEHRFEKFNCANLAEGIAIGLCYSPGETDDWRSITFLADTTGTAKKQIIPTVINEDPTYFINLFKDFHKKIKDSLLLGALPYSIHKPESDKILLIDTGELRQIPYKTIAVEFRFTGSTTQTINLLTELSKDPIKNQGFFKGKPCKDVPPIMVRVFFYMGPFDFKKNQTNGVEITFLIEPMTNKTTLLYPEKFSRNSTLMVQRTLECSKMLVEQIKEERVANLLTTFPHPSYREPFMVTLPEDQSGWADSQYQVLLEMGKDVSKNAELILAYAQETCLEFTDQELDKGATTEDKEMIKNGEGIEICAETVLNIMKRQALTEIINSKQQVTTTPTPVECLEELPSVSGKTKKSIRSNLNTNTTKPTKKVESISKKNPLSFEQKEMVKSVMEGTPMPSKEFNKLAVDVLKVKLGHKANSIKQGQKGSHPKLRFEKPDGGNGGITLWIEHGKEQQIRSQKRTLKDILDI